MNSAIDFDKIADYLKGYNNILFALVFGSTVRGKSNRLSDVDIGIYTTDEMPLLMMGKIVSGLEKIVKKEVDLVVLNDLYKRKPNFAFQVVSSARLLFTKNKDAFTDFKRNVFLYYLDARPLIEMMKASLEKRIKTDRFGERNYA
jgi:predicted nucleotidyltransferase